MTIKYDGEDDGFAGKRQPIAMTDNDKLIERLPDDLVTITLEDGRTHDYVPLSALQAAQKEIERLTGERWAFEDAVSQAIGSPRFMDPPDGGDVSLPEQVDRMHRALDAAERERDELRRALERLGSGEAFTITFFLKNNNEGKELMARRDFARAALNQEVKP